MRRVGWEVRKLAKSPVLLALTLLFLALDIALVIGSADSVYKGTPSRFTRAELRRDAAAGYEHEYADFDLNAYAESAVGILGDAPEAAREIMRWKYRLLAPRVAALAETGEGAALTVNEWRYRLRHFLYGELFQAILWQSVALAMLLAATGMEQERGARTLGLLCSARRGRHFLWDKLCAVSLLALCAYALLALVSLAAFACVYSVGEVLYAPVGSALNGVNYGLYGWQHFIPWVPFSEIGYLFASLAVGAALTLLNALLAFAACACFANTYLALAVAAFFLAAPLGCSAWGSRWLSLLSAYTPVSLIGLSRVWFSDGYYLALFPWFETASAALWLALSVLATALALRRFSEVDVCESFG